MSRTSGYTLEPFHATSPYFDEVVSIYLEAFGGEEDAIRTFIARYADTLPDWRGYIALIGAHVAGMGFGTRSLPGQWWHDRVAAVIGTNHPALQDAWVLVDLAVRSTYRNRGVGGMLLETLLKSQPCPRALLSTEVANAGARRFYERNGWQYLNPGFVFTPGQRPFVVMGREISSGVL